MLRLLFALFLLLQNSYACKEGYEFCKRKIADSHAINTETLSIPLADNRRLIHSSHMPNYKIIKHDPFLNLYLVEDKKSFPFPFKVNMFLPLGFAAVNEKSAIEGRITKEQQGLAELARFSEPLFAPSILLNSCCALEGIVTKRGIVQKEYLKRFLDLKMPAVYGDIGARFVQKGKSVVIESSDPFVDDSALQKGDEVVEFDGSKVALASELSQNILFGKVGSKHYLKIKRGSKELRVAVVLSRLYGGGFVSDTYLERFGLLFDDELRIIAMKEPYHGLNIGDRLIEINQSSVAAQSDVRLLLSDAKKDTYLLFERNRFQFFVKVN
ncbi:MAG: PDZ domain-containing protein [Epsilonproteobacteria bacterium]|nr:PDZ domain-containing protein [Campylobacterota bacterium]